MARCPECGAKLQLPPNLERWDRVYCGSCNAELEVLSLRPLELEAVYDFEEDEITDDLDEDLEDSDDFEWDEDEEEEDDNDENEDW
jgi:alpha-aminoadipate carrier protein LysW